MSMVTKRALIRWIPKEQGGRTTLPSRRGYSALVRVGNEPWPQRIGWDLVVEFIKCVGGPDQWGAGVHFCVDKAPQHLLVSGAEFSLYEGWRCVAHGMIE